MNSKKRLIPIVIVGALVLSLIAAFTAFSADDVSFVVATDVDGSNNGTLIDDTPDALDYGRLNGEFGIYIEDEDANTPVRRVLVPSDGARLSGTAYAFAKYSADGTAPSNTTPNQDATATVNVTAHSADVMVRDGELSVNDYVMIGEYTARKVTAVANPTNPTSSPVEADDETRAAGTTADPVVWALTVPITQAHFDDNPTDTLTGENAVPTFKLDTVDFVDRNSSVGDGWHLQIKSSDILPVGLVLDANDENGTVLASDVNNDALTGATGYVVDVNDIVPTGTPADTNLRITADTDANFAAVTADKKITITITQFLDSNNEGNNENVLNDDETSYVKTLVVHLLSPEMVAVTLDRPFAEDGATANNTNQPIYKLGTGVTGYSGWDAGYAMYAMGESVASGQASVALDYPIADSGIGSLSGDHAKLRSGSRSGRVKSDDLILATADDSFTIGTVTNADTVAITGLNEAAHLLYWSIEPNETTATISSQAYPDGQKVALRETQHNSGFFALRVKAIQSGKTVMPDVEKTIPEYPVNRRDVITVDSSGTSGTLTIETSAPRFTGLAPAHASTGSEDRPTITAQVTDGDAGLDRKSINIFFLIEESGQNAKGVVVNPHQDGDTDEISGGWEITGRLAGDDAPTSDATLKWWIVATDKAGNVGYTDQKQTNDDGTSNDCMEMSADAGSTDAARTSFMQKLEKDQGCQPYTVKVDNTNPKFLRAETGRHWNSALITGGSKDKTEYRVSKADKSSVMVVFDESLDASTVSANDFEVNGATPADATVRNVTVRDDDFEMIKDLDEDGNEQLVDHDDNNATDEIVKMKPDPETGTGNHEILGDNVQNTDSSVGYVFLTLSADLKPNAEPKVQLVGTVSDLAGNEQDTGVDNAATDRIAPTLTVTIDEGSRPATQARVNLTITADENIGAPTITITEVSAVDDKVFIDDNDVDNGNSTHKFVSSTEYTAVVNVGNTEDGLYTIHVEATDATGGNLGMAGDKSGSIDASSDTKAILLEHDESIGNPDVNPDEPGIQDKFTTDDANAYIRIDFSAEADEYDDNKYDINDPNTATAADDTAGDDVDTHHGVTIVSASLNGADITDALQANSAGNVFLYKSPDALAIGDHDLEVVAEDAAGNRHPAARKATITVTERKPFDLPLNPGWNLVSIPGEPADSDINAVIPADRTDITSVLSFDPTVPGMWLSATRGADGMFAGTLKNVISTRAYWVETNSFTPLKVSIPKQSAGQARILPTIEVAKGWNMIPVLDVDGNFKLDDDSDDSDKTIPASEYYSGITDYRSYTFNTITNGWELKDEVRIGVGYWLYAPKAGVIVP